MILQTSLYKENSNTSFASKYVFITIVYASLSFSGILHHEVWLDEAHHFLLARDSAAIGDLAYNARYDGHPLLWDLLLFVLTRFTHDVFYMQLLHLSISTTAVFVFLRYSPFKAVFKILFIFSYFMFYEYNIISRNYAIGILFLFVACSLICSFKKNYALILFFLLLASATHLFTLICASGLFIISCISFKNDTNRKINSTFFLFISAFFIVAVTVILCDLVPPADHMLHKYDTTPYFSLKRVGKAFSIFFKGFYHVPDLFKEHFWNTNALVDFSKNLSIIPSLACFLIPVFFFYNKAASLLLFYFGSILIALFIFFSPIIAGARYFGYVPILFVMSLWIASTSEQRKIFPDRINGFFLKVSEPAKHAFVYSFLIIQLISGISVYAIDIMRPFSEGKNAVDWIQKNIQANSLIVASNQNAGPSICSYADIKVFYPETGSMGSFCKWNVYPFVYTEDTLIKKIEKIHEHEFTLILNAPFSGKRNTASGTQVFQNNKLSLIFLKSFDTGIAASENYWIYKVTAKTNNTPHFKISRAITNF